MSHTNSTTNYGLPQFITTDKPFWLTDINGAFSDIDTAIKNAKTAGDNAQTDASQALLDAGAASSAASSAAAAASGALSSIANQFSTGSTYDVNDRVIYNNILYKCVTAITTAGPWDGTKWVTEQLADTAKATDALFYYNTLNAVNWGVYRGTIASVTSGSYNPITAGSVRNPDSFNTITDNKITIPDDALYIAIATAKTSDGSGLVGVMITEDGVDNTDAYLFSKIAGQGTAPYTAFRVIAGNPGKTVSMKVFAQGSNISATCSIDLIRVSLSRGGN